MKKKAKQENRGEIAIYKSGKNKVVLEARLRKESIWLTQAQIADLFGTQRAAITKHLRNIFRCGELKKKSVSSVLEHTAADGKIYKTQFYSLDAVISVGYRINSRRATHFRVWATRILKDHLIKGYTFNKKRLGELKGEELKTFEDAVNLVRHTIAARTLGSNEASGLLQVITEYAYTWVLLQKYDRNELAAPETMRIPVYTLDYPSVCEAIIQLKTELIMRNEASDLFGRERGGSFEGILQGIYQTFGGDELYPTIEEKAAHLLYFIIKDHPFTDGNKRIGSFLFILFLSRNKYLLRDNGEKKINDNALVAIALLVAESKPNQKDVMIKLIMNLLSGPIGKK